MTGSKNIIDALSKDSFWGPFLVLAGIFILFAPTPVVSNPFITYIILGAGIFLLASGVYLMLRQVSRSVGLATVNQNPGSFQDADYIVRQLTRNYELLRVQTYQGFILSSVFMAVGLLILIISLFGSTFGITSALSNEGSDGLGILAGIITEFISGTIIVIYRDNFQRLNKTSERLDNAWRILAAFKLTDDLPEEKKAEATLSLIEALTQSSQK